MSAIELPRESSNLASIVSIYGTVQAVHQRCFDPAENPGPDDKLDQADKCECHFSIVNEVGRFSIRAIGPPHLCDLLESSQVQVIGTLHSSFFRQCHQHHHQIEALVVMILATDEQGQDRVLSILHSERFDS